MENWIKSTYNRIQKNTETFLGYPLAKDFKYDQFAPFLNLCINNVGDPENNSTLAIDTKEIELKVVRFFSKVLQATPEDVWGYVTNGGTEGNLYGLYVAREAFSNATVYYSESTHYSVKKNLHLLQLPNVVIRSQENGEMDYEDLESVLILHRDKPAIFFLNIGTTMTEAVDQIDEIKKIIKKYAIKNYYIHCDAAFLGSFAPFVDEKPKFDFSNDIDSISISGHKFIGSPIPCGLVLVKRKHRNRIANSVSYVDTMDTTITGSRNGLTPLFLWSFIEQFGIEGLQKRAKEAQKLARYTEHELNKIGQNAWRNKDALTVVFDSPSKEIIKQFQLATDGNISHLICVPGITKENIDNFIVALQQEQTVKKLVIEDDETSTKKNLFIHS
ncbi:histidine decarboxylase [Mangrovimonas sp. CR14]|uniref:histidine decarboxylase n=1 Tax=Mangrovimonas sp. CR14 TaxID=2706120 RepID=UPI00141F8B31|nr:histidine decarboxylase [Mangrovimonas sp. CR14]NIK93403.1 histidine decarboxylase [Mangrovimonas sp. CR14]